MLTIFDYINAAVFTKDKNIIQTVEDEASLSPYMLNRWISMYSPDMANIVNMTTNRYISTLNKQEFFNFIVAVFPKVKFKRIAYIKKVSTKTKEKEEEDDSFTDKKIAQLYECSSREIREMKEMVDLLKTCNQ